MNKPFKLQVTPTSIHDVLIIEPSIFSDERGWLTESFNAKDFAAAIGRNVDFVQENHTFSPQWTLRGLHYQLEHTQGKLVRVIAGSVFDVVVDIRQDSPSYGKWTGVELSSQNRKQVWIPGKLAHGFLVLSETAEFIYKTTDYYHPQSEACLVWNDPTVDVKWPLPEGIKPNMNTKDAIGHLWCSAPKF